MGKNGRGEKEGLRAAAISGVIPFLPFPLFELCYLSEAALIYDTFISGLGV